MINYKYSNSGIGSAFDNSVNNKPKYKLNKENYLKIIRESKIARLEESFTKIVNLESNKQNKSSIINDNNINKQNQKPENNKVHKSLNRILSNSKIPKLKTDSSKDNIQNIQNLNINELKHFKSHDVQDCQIDNQESSNDFEFEKLKLQKRKQSAKNHLTNNLKNHNLNTNDHDQECNELDNNISDNNSCFNTNLNNLNTNQQNHNSLQSNSISNLRSNISSKIKAQTQLNKAEKRSKKTLNTRSRSIKAGECNLPNLNLNKSKMDSLDKCENDTQLGSDENRPIKRHSKYDNQFNHLDRHIILEVNDSRDSNSESVLAENHPFQKLDNLENKLKELDNLVRLSAKLDNSITNDKIISVGLDGAKKD